MRLAPSLLLSLAFLATPALAQRDRRPDAPPAPADSKDGKDPKEAKKDEKKEPPPAVTHHAVTVGGRAIKYTTTAGYIEQPDYEGKPKANVFYVSYVKDAEEGAATPTPRPVMFCFNGGPGSSSVWLHLGAIGPRRVDFADPNEKPGEPSIPAPPYHVVDNEFTWLDAADLVFIDPVSTGYSRPLEGENPNQFHGLNEDIRWVGDFIRLWTTKNKRWDSAKFLAGESYGTTRAAGLSGYLQDTHGMYLNGIVLISPVLNFQTLEFDAGNDTPYWLFLPTYTATAWYHRKLEGDLQRDLTRTLDEARKWANTEYLVALGKGDALTEKEREAVATKLAKYTGLSRGFCERARLRIDLGAFDKELLRDQGRTVGRLDTRYKGIDRTGNGDGPDYDASYSAIQGPFTAAMNHYVRAELEYENDRPYEILTGRVHPWSYSSATNRYADVAGTLRGAMTENRNLHVLVCSGYYDGATPFHAATYTIDHLGLDPSLRGHISQAFYECGHMMYIRHVDLVKLRADVGGFMERAVGAK